MGRRKTKPDKILAIFKKLDGEIIAFLPRSSAHYGNIMTFSSTGYNERPMRDYFESQYITPCEYAPLLRTMQALGDNVLVRNRMTYADRMYSWKVV